MTPEHLQKARALFNSAVLLPESGRDEFLHQACGDDPGMYREVERMLQQHEASGAPPVFQQGQIVAGRYRILRYLNRGGMGEVYEAQDLDLELAETIALKTLLPAIAGDESMIARFKQEIALSRKISHPNVCKVFDLARHENESGRPVFFLTMEFLAGETLAAKLQRDGAMKECEALPLLRQMGAALDASHDCRVIHRDFKPSNVMLVVAGDSHRAVVTDFGLARRFVAADDPTVSLSNAVVGTVDYMAPELLTGAVATFASDVYALGMVAYKMVTGTLPFAGDTPMAGAIQRAKRAVPSPRVYAPGLDAQWERAILRVLERNPAKRFTSARHFLEAIRGEPVSMTVKLPVVTQRRAVIAAVVAVAVLAAAVGWREHENAIHRLPPEALALYRKGAADIAAGAYFAATQALQEAVKFVPHAAQIHARLAEAWVELDMSDRAGQEMLLVRRESSSDLSKLDRLQVEAIDLQITREFAAAAAKYEEMARAGGDRADVAVDLGRAYEKADRPDDAIRSYQRAAEGPEHNPAAWLRLGVLYSRQSSADKSNEAFAQAERSYRLTSNLEGLTEVALQQGIAANTRGQLDAGAAYIRNALETARLAGNLHQEINATLRLSANAYQSGDAAAAERYAREALDTARSHQLEALAIRGLVNLGNAFRRKQDFPHTEQYYLEALNLARQARSAPLVALSLSSLAALHDQTQKPGKSLVEAQEALAFYQANHYAKQSLQCLGIIARAKAAGDDYDGALASFHSLLQSAEKEQDRSQMASAHEGIGANLFRQDRFPEALEEYRKSLELAADAEHLGYASLQCGDTLWRLGRYPEAIAMLAKADASAPKFPPLRLGLVYARAGMLLSQGRFQEAADLARAALAADAAKTPDLDAKIDQVLGLALMGAGNKTEGVKECERARVTTEAGGDRSDILDAEVAALQARLANGDRKSALELIQQIEPRLAARPELRWRALALVSRADAQYAARAREALLQLSRQWGDSAYNEYLTRPDIGKLSRPLLQAVSAIH